MSAHLSGLYRLSEKDIPVAASMFIRAYMDYPFTLYLAARVDKADFDRFANIIYHYNFREGIRHGDVYAPSANIEGAAIWKDSVKHVNLLQSLRAGGWKVMRALGLKRMKLVFGLIEYCEKRRKDHAPKQYKHLSGIGVDPVHQGKGHASTLIRAMLAETDKIRLDCVLETQTESNVRMYQHLGFDVVDDSEILTTEIKNYIMVRRAQ